MLSRPQDKAHHQPMTALAFSQWLKLPLTTRHFGPMWKRMHMTVLMTAPSWRTCECRRLTLPVFQNFRRNLKRSIRHARSTFPLTQKIPQCTSRCQQVLQTSSVRWWSLRTLFQPIAPSQALRQHLQTYVGCIPSFSMGLLPELLDDWDLTFYQFPDTTRCVEQCALDIDVWLHQSSPLFPTLQVLPEEQWHRLPSWHRTIAHLDPARQFSAGRVCRSAGDAWWDGPLMGFLVHLQSLLTHPMGDNDWFGTRSYKPVGQTFMDSAQWIWIRSCFYPAP